MQSKKRKLNEGCGKVSDERCEGEKKVGGTRRSSISLLLVAEEVLREARKGTIINRQCETNMQRRGKWSTYPPKTRRRLCCENGEGVRVIYSPASRSVRLV